MKRTYLALCAAAFIGLASCTANQVSATVLASYDTAVAAEITALNSGKISQAEAANLANLRNQAWAAVQAVTTAETNGGTASPTVSNAATAAIAALLTEAQKVGG